MRTCGAVVAVLRGHDNTVLNAGEWNQQVVGAIRAAAFNSDDSLLVSASRDGCVLVWDTTTFSLRHRLHEHTRSIVSMAITSPNALFTTGEDAQLIRWDLNEGRRVKCVQAHSGTILDEGGWLEEVEGAVKAMTMIGDGDVILTGSADAQIKGFDMDLNVGAVGREGERGGRKRDRDRHTETEAYRDRDRRRDQRTDRRTKNDRGRAGKHGDRAALEQVFLAYATPHQFTSPSTFLS